MVELCGCLGLFSWANSKVEILASLQGVDSLREERLRNVLSCAGAASDDPHVVWWDVGSGSIQLLRPCGVLCGRFPEIGSCH